MHSKENVLSVSAAPTVILVNKNRQVLDSWVGKLSEKEKKMTL